MFLHKVRKTKQWQLTQYLPASTNTCRSLQGESHSFQKTHLGNIVSMANIMKNLHFKAFCGLREYMKKPLASISSLKSFTNL
jgi:hypothetical protein